MNPSTPPYKQLLTTKRLVLVGLLAVVLFVFYWVATHAYIQVTVESSSNDAISYVLASPNQGRSEQSNAPKTIKKLVRKGGYEVEVRQGGAAYFAVVQSGGFLSTKSVSAKLTGEKGRRFIGNGPEACIYFLSGLLTSYECNGSMTTLQKHMPATTQLPTITRTSDYATEDVIEGLIKTKEGNVLLLRTAQEATEPGFPHAAFLLRNDLYPDRLTPLEALKKEHRYNLKPYRDGFVAYSQDFSDAHYYSSIGAKAEDVTLGRADAGNLEPYALDARGGAIVTAYSQKLKGQDAEDPDKQVARSSELVLQDNGNEKHFSFSKTYKTVRLCGINQLCGLAGEQLDVYDISSSSAKLSFSIGARFFDVLPDRLAIVKEKEVVLLDLKSLTGAAQFSMGGYDSCGVRAVEDSYALCLINSIGKRVAVLIDQNRPSDDIDKKVLGLLKLPTVKDVSIYGNFITVSPDVGKATYTRGVGYGFSQARLREATASIQSEVTKLGIDRAVYSVRTTLR